jgi:hypothetical protein
VDGEDPADAPGIALLGDNDAVARALASGEAQVLGGTAWVWAGGAGGDLLDGDFAPGGCAARNGVSVQHQSTERGDVAGPLRGDRRGE